MGRTEPVPPTLKRPVRRALLVVGGDAFRGLGGFAGVEMVSKGGLDVLSYGGGPEFFHEALRIGDRTGCTLKNGGRYFLHLGLEVARRNNAIDQADFTGALGIEQFGREEGFAEIAFPELATHEGHDKSGDEPAPHFGITESRALGGDGEIA